MIHCNKCGWHDDAPGDTLVTIGTIEECGPCGSDNVERCFRDTEPYLCAGRIIAGGFLEWVAAEMCIGYTGASSHTPGKDSLSVYYLPGKYSYVSRPFPIGEILKLPDEVKKLFKERMRQYCCIHWPD